MKAVVTGMIATYGLGGVTWDYGQYALALERLGFEVYYLEYTGGHVYDSDEGAYGSNWSAGVDFLKSSLAELSPGLADRWHFRTMDDQCFGMDEADISQIVAEADIFLNVSGSCLLRPEFMASRRKVMIDTDPGWNHFVTYKEWDEVWGSGPGLFGSVGYRAHDFFFTYAEKMGDPDCPLPSLGLDWLPTRPPVVLDRWSEKPPGDTWTTVMTWDNFRRPIQYQGKTYGTKELEFPRIEKLPELTSAPLEVAAGGNEAPRDHWQGLGWRVIDSHSVSRSAEEYRSYIERSRGEFSVAKNVYVDTRCGWFSCRSVCYLASGRPVVIQDTGFSEVIPTGEGVLTFSNVDEARDALDSVEADYPRHQKAAGEIAKEFFDSDRVVGALLDRVGL